MAYAYKQNRSNLGSMGAVDDDNLAAGKKRGLEAVYNYKEGLNQVTMYNPLSEEEAFYRGFVEGYNNELESVWEESIEASEFSYIGLNDAKRKIRYEVQKVETESEPEQQTSGSSQPDSGGMNPFDWLNIMDPDASWMKGGADQKPTEEIKSEAVITDIRTGKKETVTTKKGGSGLSLPIMIALGAGAVLLILLLKGK